MVAKVVAGRVGIPVVSFSGPGMIYGHRAMHVPRSAIDEHFINVVNTENDLIPKIDKQGGTVLNTRCPKITNPMACHMMDFILCK